MSIYQITYFEAEVQEAHDCGCGRDHEHYHDENCNHDNEHVHDENCNHDNDHEHHHHHSNLPRKIKSLGKWANIMPTTFLLHTEMNAGDIKLALDEVIESNETFFVSEITSNNAGSMHPNALAWIETRLK